ncbi:peptidyl-prolyl cis-trans isomerase FKBP2 isoform X2 [Narcine bancroftii]|uniref:peptidyl-prolyl cis-trans isomerase FKBP2 isoform X2 n=1 Tax=Narcine bancroftii TaxID=1343680 RepID=UPI0038321F0D
MCVRLCVSASPSPFLLMLSPASPPCAPSPVLPDVEPCAPPRGPSPVPPDGGPSFPQLFAAMKLVPVMPIVSLLVTALCGLSQGESEKRKLQIGIKKRIDSCPLRSRKSDTLHMHYTGKLEDGTEFDSSVSRGTPFIFTLGTGQVIKGWDQGLLGMCEGEKRKLVIPSELGGATLVFEVELLKIERRTEL